MGNIENSDYCQGKYQDYHNYCYSVQWNFQEWNLQIYVMPCLTKCMYLVSFVMKITCTVYIPTIWTINDDDCDVWLLKLIDLLTIPINASLNIMTISNNCPSPGYQEGEREGMERGMQHCSYQPVFIFWERIHMQQYNIQCLLLLLPSRTCA